MVTGVISSMETAAVNLLNAVLHTAVSYIISIPTQDKDNNLWCGSHAYTTGCGPYSMLYTHYQQVPSLEVVVAWRQPQ